MKLLKFTRALLTVILVASTSACTLSTERASGTATSQAYQVATQVALMLTSTVNSIALTPVITPGKGNLATSTTTPALFVSPSVTSTSAPTLTATPSPTPLATTTPSIQPSPTLNPTDPSASLGKPTWTTNFTSGKAFGLTTPVDDPEYHFEVTNGAMEMIGKKPDGFHAWRLVFNTIQNFYLEAPFQTSTCSGLDRYGFIFRSPDNNTGYFYGVSCDGQYSLRILESSGFSDLIKWTKSNDIHAGANQTNLLGVMAKDNIITLYANGHSLASITDSTFTKGVFGYFIASINTPNFTVLSNAISYWSIP